MSKKLRFLLVLVFLGLAGYLIYPTVSWYFLTSPEKQELANGSKENIRDYARTQANDDLDELKQLTKSEESITAAIPEKYAFLTKTARKNYKVLDKDQPEEWTTGDVLRGFSSGNEVYEELELHYKTDILKLKTRKEKTLQLGLDLFGGMSIVLTAIPKYVVEEAEEDILDEGVIGKVKSFFGRLFLGKKKQNGEVESDIVRAMEILNNRIDELGVVEPQIRKMNDDQILVEIPGEFDPDRVNSFLKGKGTLGFYLVDDEGTEAVNAYIARGGIIDENGRPEEAGILREGLTARGYYTKDNYGLDLFQRYIVLEEPVGMDGGYVESAQVYADPTTGKPNVSFYLSSDGGEIFYQLTRDNVERFLAVVMDNKIKAYARITEPLRSQVRITGFDQDEANDLALILRTAALPVELKVESLQSVGATMGKDTIEAGLWAILYGFAAVFVFMLIYYKGSGVIANVALILNLLLITAVLSALNMTLTMTSIAGIILNVGMAVDANVIIFERIKEEIRLGKSRAAAVEAGFKKAFWTVMDANITTFIAAIFLSMVGSGPVQGFAVTLAVGIICSMFTALFVSRFVFDFCTDVLKRDKVSIGWGLYR